ncbi:MAG: acyl-CoA thioesterase domain-containing protein, partial [Myxococcota bacterium]
MSQAFYRRDDAGSLVPTPYTIGPWDPRFQHGGPPAALLAGAAERFGDDAAAFVVTRVTVELLRPLGLVPLRVKVTPLRLGRQAQWLEATLEAEGKLLARAGVVRIARADVALPPRFVEPDPPPPGPEGYGEFVIPLFEREEGYHRGVDVRIVEGVWGEGPLTAWMRPRVPLVEGETASPLERAMILVDAVNGLAPALPFRAFGFINPDLTVHLRRPLEGEWLAIAGRSIPERPAMASHSPSRGRRRCTVRSGLMKPNARNGSAGASPFTASTRIM